MKKIFILISSILLLAMSFTVAAVSETGESVTIEGGIELEPMPMPKENVYRGSTVEFLVTLEGPYTVKAGAMEYSYDESVLTFESAQWCVENTIIDDFNTEKQQGVFACDKGEALKVNANTVIAVLTFTVKEDAAFGSIPTLNTEIQFTDSETNEIFAITQDYELSEVKCDHPYAAYSSNNDATCTSDGTKTGYCDICDSNNTVTDIGSMLPHSFGEYYSDGNATCTSDGTKSASCYACAAVDTVIDYGSALGHSFVYYISNGDATYFSDGTKSATCENGCGEIDTVVDEGSKLDAFAAFPSFVNSINDGMSIPERYEKIRTALLMYNSLTYSQKKSVKNEYKTLKDIASRFNEEISGVNNVMDDAVEIAFSPMTANGNKGGNK